MTKARILSGLSLGLLLATAQSAFSDAARPLVQPPISIKLTKLQTPISLSDVLVKKIVGLDMESPSVAKEAQKQAKAYVEYRRGLWPRAKVDAWFNGCEKNISAKEPNPFCRIEQERTAQVNPSSKFAAQSRRERKSLTELLKSGDYAKADSKTYGEVVGAVGSMGDIKAILPIAKQVAQSKSCVAANFTTALGYKIEELFPDKDVVELSKTLYRKSVDCGKDLALATASFRLGLIQIWQKQYSEIDSLMRKVESVPEAQPLHARAKYWRYQTAVVLGNVAGRADAKEILLKDHPLTFQNLAANGEDTLMMDRVISREMPNVYTRSLIRPDVNGVIRAAEALEKVGSNQLAAEILDRSVIDIATIEPEVRLYTASFLHRIGYSLAKFKILSSLFQDSPKLVTAATMELMFPLSYVDLVRAKQNQVDPLLFLSLMRQESAFNPEARSGVGARGLMQVMPATARMMRPITKAQLFQPELNIEVGTKYFLKRLGQYNGDVELTLAAYNAGSGRVDQWIKRYPTDNKFLFLDFIPFRETRDYVSSILRNYYWYTRLYAPDAATVALETGKLQPMPGKMQSILAANAGDAARLTMGVRSPATSVVPSN